MILVHLNVFSTDTTLCETCESVGFVLANVGNFDLSLTSASAQNWKQTIYYDNFFHMSTIQ